MLKIDSRVQSDEYDCKGTIIAFAKEQAVVQFDDVDVGLQLCDRDSLSSLPTLEEEFKDQVNTLIYDACRKIDEAQALAHTQNLSLSSTAGRPPYARERALVFDAADMLLVAFDNAGWNTSTMTRDC